MYLVYQVKLIKPIESCLGGFYDEIKYRRFRLKSQAQKFMLNFNAKNGFYIAEVLCITKKYTTKLKIKETI